MKLVLCIATACVVWGALAHIGWLILFGLLCLAVLAWLNC
jgi:hypothetical protein